MLELIKNGGIVVGVVISVYTAYMAIDGYLRRRRQQYALLKYLHSEFSYFLVLASSLANRAKQAKQLYPQHLTGDYPNPAKDQDSLPQDAEIVSRWLVKRANHMIEYDLPIDVEKLGP